MKLDSFEASTWWLNEFKKKNNLVSRKTTKWVSYRHVKSQQGIETNATAFHVELTDDIYPNFGPTQILNSDQTGYQYEMHRDRTLDHAGVKQVAVQVMYSFATTHSYTIQPVISMEDKLGSKIMIVLQKKGEKFGPIVQQNLLRPPNVFLSCSRSGKVGASILLDWTRNCSAPFIGEKACLIIDSYSQHRYAELLSVPGKRIEIKIILPGATPLIQPLDVFFFRRWKSFTEKFFDRVLLDNLPIDLHNRNTVIKIHAPIHNQFFSPRFEKMMKYAWKKSGFLVEIEAFDHPDHLIFDTLLESCSLDDCNSSFIQCSWCQKHFCLPHFFNLLHYCQAMTVIERME